MLLQAKNKKGVSIMVGYVLLVVFAIILSVIAYQWIKTYVPSESLQCPDSGVSVSIKSLYYDCGGGNNNLYLNVKNSGRFSILGYFAHAANVSEQEVATIDLSQYFNETLSGGQIFGNSIAFISAEDNLFKPGDEKVAIFNLTDVGVLTSIQITPTRMQEVDNKNRFISCGDEKVKQDIYCGMDTRIVDTVCTPENPVVTCGGFCGPRLNNCGTEVSCSVDNCDGSEACTNGVCVPLGCVDEDIGVTCGSWVCGSKFNNCGNLVVCPPDACSSGFSCDESIGQCISTVNDGNCDPEETCADADCDGKRNGCTEGNVCNFISESCVLDIPDTVTNCADFCVFIGDYSGGTCKQNSGCPGGGIYTPDGDGFCPPDNPLQDFCCCNP